MNINLLEKMCISTALKRKWECAALAYAILDWREEGSDEEVGALLSSHSLSCQAAQAVSYLGLWCGNC